MPHTVWDLGSLVASARVQPRQFIAGIEPARDVFIGRSREPKKMLVILDAWIEVRDFRTPQTLESYTSKYGLALGKDPLNTALILPVGSVSLNVMNTDVGNTDQPATAAGRVVEQLFHARGTMWAVKEIAIDVQETGDVTVDVDLHMDWRVAEVDWWTWFASWDALEAFPDGSLVDGERAYP